MPECYICGSTPASKPLKLADSFTNHSACRVPTSDKMCDRCAWVIPLRCWYWNEGKQKWSKLFARNWSWLLSGKSRAPKFSQERTEGKDTLPVVSELPTRALIREWLLNPPEPPFTIAIAESGQKHILPWAQEAYSRDRFPIQLEMDVLYIDRSQFGSLLSTYEALMALEFSKTEIDTGEYRSDRLMSHLEQWEPLELVVQPHRSTRLLQLISYVAQREESAKPSEQEPESIPTEQSLGTLGRLPSIGSGNVEPVQLALFSLTLCCIACLG